MSTHPCDLTFPSFHVYNVGLRVVIFLHPLQDQTSRVSHDATDIVACPESRLEFAGPLSMRKNKESEAARGQETIQLLVYI